MKRLLTSLLALALLLTPTLARAQLWTPSGEPWFSEVQDIGVTGSYGVLVPNEGTTGTTDGLVACLTTAGVAITCPTVTTLDVIGPVQRNGGTTGSALIANSGIAAICQFDGATTAGHYAQPSTTVAGNCHDAGANFPANGLRVLGTITTTNGASGVYPVFMYGRGTRGGVSLNTVPKGVGGAAGGIVDSSITDDTSFFTVGTLAGSGTRCLTVNSTGRFSGAPCLTQTWAVVNSDVTHTQSNTTLSDVTSLAFVACTTATEVWQFEAQLLLTAANATADWKFGWTVPSGATMFWGPHNAAFTAATAYFDGNSTAANMIALLTESSTLSIGSAAVTGGFYVRGFVFCSSVNVALVQLQFAQNTSNASDITVKKGSVLIARKLIP